MQMYVCVCVHIHTSYYYYTYVCKIAFLMIWFLPCNKYRNYILSTAGETCHTEDELHYAMSRLCAADLHTLSSLCNLKLVSALGLGLMFGEP